MTIESNRFVVLARHDGTAARGRLLTMLSGEILDSRDRTESEVAIFFDISRLLIEQVDRVARRAFSEKVASSAECPHDILLRLAGDDIIVAEPVLVHGARLDEADLIDLAASRGSAHRAAIALRRDLSPLLARTLIQAGDREVFLRLGANRTIVLDAELLRSFRLRAETDQRLREILDARPEFRAGANHVGGKVDRRNARTPRIGEPAEDVAAIVARLQAGAITIDSAVVELADADRQADLVALFGRLAGIDPTGVMRVLVRRDVEGIATLAGALDVGQESFARVVELRRRRLGFSTSQARWEREAYRRIDRVGARTTLAQVGGRRNAG